jgi:hypothetical protein
VAELGPALCSVCFPEAPVESREQARIPARLALCLAEKGVAAFEAARAEARAKAADRCPGSGQTGTPDRYGYGFVRCPACGCGFHSNGGKVRVHKAPKYFVRQAWGSKCWTGSGWGTSSKAAIYATREEANAVAAAVSTPDEKAESVRK